MKKILSLVLASLTAASALASCAPARPRLDDAISLASSDAQECAAWLDERLDAFPTDVIVGIGSNEAYGIDMSEFDEDGYILRSFGNDTLVFGATAEGLDRAVRAYAKAADAGSAAQLDETYHEGARIKSLTIAGRDISEYTVIYNFDREVKNIGADAPTFGNAKYAAEELVRLIAQATGITLTAVPHTEKVDTPAISIDYYTDGDLGENGFTYEVKDGNIYINGVGRANGCVNAIYYLLEHECGWDALLFGDSDLREAEHVNIPEGISKKIKPMFNYYWMREMFYDDYDTDRSTFSAAYRGSVAQASHKIGDWAGTDSNICPSDDLTYYAVYDNVVGYIEANINAGKIIGEDFVAIDLGMEDATNLCMCRKCIQVFKEEKKAPSGAQVRFANRLAADVEDTGYCGMKYSIFAYAGSNAPCITHTREDVYVTYCTNGHCQNHKLDGSECYEESCVDMGNVNRKYGGDNALNNEEFAKWLKGWNDVCDNVYVYTYMLPANFAQYTNMRTLYDDVHFIYDSGMEGFSPEGPYPGLGLNRLRFCLIMDMMWHPEMTKDEYELRVDEHMRREYGDGYDLVKDHIRLWEETEYGTGCWYAWILGSLISTDTFDLAAYAERAPRMYSLLEEAMKLCNTEKQEERLKRLAVDVLYKECSIKYFPAYDSNDTDTIEYLEGRYEIFVSYMEDCGYEFGVPPKDIWAFGPYAYNKTYRTTKKSLQSSLTDAAWIDWIKWRDDLTPEGTTQRPMPDGYEPYIPE